MHHLVLVVPIHRINQLLAFATFFSFILLSVSFTSFRPFYLFMNCISYSTKLLLLAYHISCQVVLSASHMKQYHVVVSSLISPIRISYFYHLRVSANLFALAVPSYSYKVILSTTSNRCSLLLLTVYQLLLTVSPFYCMN